MKTLQTLIALNLIAIIVACATTPSPINPSAQKRDTMSLEEFEKISKVAKEYFLSSIKESISNAKKLYSKLEEMDEKKGWSEKEKVAILIFFQGIYPKIILTEIYSNTKTRSEERFQLFKELVQRIEGGEKIPVKQKGRGIGI